MPLPSTTALDCVLVSTLLLKVIWLVLELELAFAENWKWSPSEEVKVELVIAALMLDVLWTR